MSDARLQFELLAFGIISRRANGATLTAFLSPDQIVAWGSDSPWCGRTGDDSSSSSNPETVINSHRRGFPVMDLLDELLSPKTDRHGARIRGASSWRIVSRS